ncbi:hypothetical protein LCGC14_0388810 [marine sediment metagenome]|uniref:Uncharacterized protein n=1 Tax=marine sediment metagenome TaxID=412755 RepID=A0A0F9T614_9ZZZZ
MAHYRYTIETKAGISQAMLDVCVQTAVKNLRTSNDGLLAVLKWRSKDPNPPNFDGKTKYDHVPMLMEMDKANWKAPDIT